MINESFGNRSSRTVVVAEATSVRQMLSDVVRNLGFLDITVLASGEDTLRFLEVEDCNWLILPLMATGEVNALQILRVISATPRLRQVRTTLLYEAQEDVVLPAAFQMGLLSCHPRSYLRDDVLSELKALIALSVGHASNPVLVAAEYLRRYLIKAKQFGPALLLEQNLLGLFPGSAGLLLRLAEAQILNDKKQEGLLTLQQAVTLDETAKESAEKISTRLLNVKLGASSRDAPAQNALGIKSCVLIDPDSAVLNGVRDLLQSVGVRHVEVFDNGASAWEWLRGHEEPDLILQEWRIPGLSGPMLLQRIRQHGFCRAAISILSSVIKPKEVHLLREMGVDDVVAKPFARQDFFKSVIWTIQQNVSPSERGSLERKISRLLQAGQAAEAERLKAIFLADQRITTAPKKLIQAEFAFHYGRYREARDLGIESLRLAGDSLKLLNLIGKALIKLGDHGAALKFFEKAHVLSPLNIEHLCNLAVCQFDSGNDKGAQATIVQAKQLDAKSDLLGQTECELSILRGHTGKARELMGQLSSVGKIVAYMNNRAVALSRCGRYEDGIKLYQQTFESLPGEAGDTHDVVAYNLGLAYARYGDLAQACAQLERVCQRPNAPLLRKAESLLKRIKVAEAKGTALTFAESSPAEGGLATVEGKDDAKAGVDEAQVVSASIEIQRGDLCLYGIFHLDSIDRESERLLEKTPRFVTRSRIERSENMTQIRNDR